MALKKSGNNTTTDTFTYSANGLIATAVNATDSIRTVSVPSALLDSVETTMKAAGVAPYTYTVVHHYTNSASGTDSITVSSSGAPAQFVTRRYVNDGGSGTLSGIDLGPGIGASTFGYTQGWRTSTVWPTGAGSSATYFSTGTHSLRTFGSKLDPSFYAAYAVDSAGRILRDRRHDGSPTAYTQRLFGYDDLGEFAGSKDVSSIAWNCGGSGSFDPNYGYVGCPMDTVTAPSYETYDDAGNPNASWFARGTADQLATAGISNMTYDADGNVVTHTFGGSGIAERDYSWSAENLLTVGRMQGDSVRLEYDPLGQPVVRRGRAGEGVRVTLYDGTSILADLDSAGNRIAEYVYDQGTDRPYAMLTGSTTVTGAQYFVEDDMGNVQGTLKDSATVAQRVTYDDFGTPAVLGDTTNRLTWKGLSYDQDLMLTYMRARWYDPMVGRFVSEDPLGLAGGINPYVYANNDPVNGSDPSGMSDNLPRLSTVNVSGAPDYWLFSFQSLLDELGGGGGSPAVADSVPNFSGGGGDGTSTATKSAKTKPSVLHCAGQTAKSNGVTLGLDVAGFIPGEKLLGASAGAVTMVGVGIAASATSLYRGDLAGFVAGSAGSNLAAIGSAAKSAGYSAAEAIPVIGTVINAGVTAVDLYHAYQSYQACRAGH